MNPKGFKDPLEYWGRPRRVVGAGSAANLFAIVAPSSEDRLLELLRITCTFGVGLGASQAPIQLLRASGIGAGAGVTEFVPRLPVGAQCEDARVPGARLINSSATDGGAASSIAATAGLVISEVHSSRLLSAAGWQDPRALIIFEAMDGCGVCAAPSEGFILNANLSATDLISVNVLVREWVRDQAHDRR